MDRAEILAVLGEVAKLAGNFDHLHKGATVQVYVQLSTLRAARALRDQLAAPEGGPVAGWQMVPETPTPQMRAAGSDALVSIGKFGPAPALTVYRAMLAAAPAHPTLPVRLETTAEHDQWDIIAGAIARYNAGERDADYTLGIVDFGFRLLRETTHPDAGKQEREAVVRFLQQEAKSYTHGSSWHTHALILADAIERSDHLPGAAQKETT